MISSREQWEIQKIAIWRAYDSIYACLVNQNPPPAGTLMRALYDEHMAAVERGEIRRLL